MGIKTLNLGFNLETNRAGSLARIGHEPPKLGVAGSNPVPPAAHSFPKEAVQRKSFSAMFAPNKLFLDCLSSFTLQIVKNSDPVQ